MVKFKNISGSPCQLREPAWQAEITKRVESEFGAQALEAGRYFAAQLNEKLSQTLPENAALAVDALMRGFPRYAFITNISAVGCHFDVQIDLLLRTVLIIEI